MMPPPPSFTLSPYTTLFRSIALFIFPPIGHALAMTQRQFGIWAAIAIHDTSSVVGAAQRFGFEAQRIATTVKLTRAQIGRAHVRTPVTVATPMPSSA